MVREVDARWAKPQVISMAKFEEGLCRIMYVARPLEYERPFLAPLYKFLCMHPHDPVRRVPGYVKFFLRCLSAQLQQQRHYDCAAALQASSIAPRVDAQASDGRTGIGGWLPAIVNGVIDIKSSRWFSLEITEADIPWVFMKERKPSLIIATLEALAVLLSLKVFYGDQPPEGMNTRVQVVPTWTDNRGNGSALNKLMTTRFLASAVVMELAAYMKVRSLKSAVQWAPRSVNQEADSLANGDTSAFQSRTS